MTRPFNYQERASYYQKLTGEIQDLIVVGGGVTGAGILLDATTRGMKTCLFEMQDFSEGTSSRSTKLVHGGLRYLKQFEFSLVKEVGRERAIVFDNGPHVTKSEPMLLPLIKGGSIGTLGALFGMWLYDTLAGVLPKERRKILHKISVLALEPSLKEEILNSGAYYYEYRTDDSRLTIEIIKAAVERNAVALNYTKVIGFLYEAEKISGVKVHDALTDRVYEVRGKVVVNATGPWVDATDSLDRSAKNNKLLLSKGIHLVVDASRFPIGQAMYFDAGKGRMVFAIPREGKVYIGTTESIYTGDIGHPYILKEERDYLLGAVNNLFNGINLQPSDVESGWAGLRPLIKQEGKKPGEISRKDETFEHSSGLISIAGGKLTGYRKMAERIVDLVARRLSKDAKNSFGVCVTDKTPISGGEVGGGENFSNYCAKIIHQYLAKGYLENELLSIVNRYGSNSSIILALVEEYMRKETLLNPYRLAELEYAIQYEMVVTPLDFLVRRIGAAYFSINRVIEEKELIYSYMNERFKWNQEVAYTYKKELDTEIERLVAIKKL